MIENFLKYIPNKLDNYVIFDIGSRDCSQSIEFYNNFPNSKIYAFECNPNTLELCKKNIEKYSDRITLIEGAVCEHNGTIDFYPINQQKTVTTWEDGNPGASSLFKSNGSYNLEYYVQDKTVVNCHRLDHIMNKFNIPKVDIIWMDLQGAELLALKGLGSYLNDVKYIHTEVSYKEIYTDQVLFHELNDFLKNKFEIINTPSYSGWQEDIIYKKTIKEFDIVIPVGPKDVNVIKEQIIHTKKNIIGYRNIYILSNELLNKEDITDCILINEHIFPFSKNTVTGFHGKLERNGWYYQQLLKLYAGFCIPDILERYLVIDADTFFLKPTTFIRENKCLYNTGCEYNIPYFEHMKRLSPSLYRVINRSGICHHMMFETKIVQELFNLVESKHNDKFYNVFLKNVSKDHYGGAGASEYEIYFNYILNYHSDKIKIRELNWNDSYKTNLNRDYDYVSAHWYLRKN